MSSRRASGRLSVPLYVVGAEDQRPTVPRPVVGQAVDDDFLTVPLIDQSRVGASRVASLAPNGVIRPAIGSKLALGTIETNDSESNAASRELRFDDGASTRILQGKELEECLAKNRQFENHVAGFAVEKTSILNGDEVQQWLAVHGSGIQGTTAQNPEMQNPEMQNPGMQNPGVHNPSAPSPSVILPPGMPWEAVPTEPVMGPYSQPAMPLYGQQGPAAHGAIPQDSRVDHELFALPHEIANNTQTTQKKPNSLITNVALGIAAVALVAISTAIALPEQRSALHESLFPGAGPPVVLSSEIADELPAPTGSEFEARVQDSPSLAQAAMALAEGRRVEALKIYEGLTRSAPNNRLYRQLAQALKVSEAAK